MSLIPNNSPQKNNPSYLVIFATVGILTAILVTIYYSITVFQNPGLFPSFPKADRLWALTYIIFALLVMGLMWVLKGKLLLVFLSASCISFLALAVFVQGVAASLLVLVLLTFLSAAVGNFILWKLGLCENLALIEKLTFSTSTGLAVLMALISIAGFTHLLLPWIAWSMVIVLTIVFVPGFIKRNLYGFISTYSKIKSALYYQDLRFSSYLIALFLITFFGAAIWSITPATNFDALNYHIGVPEIYIRAQGIIPVIENQNSFLAHYAEMLYTLALLLTGQPLPGLLHLLFSLLSAGFAYSMARKFSSFQTSMISAILFYSAPFVAFQAGIPKNELFMAAYCAAAMLATYEWYKKNNRKWLLIASLMIGFAVGIKTSALPILFPLGIVIILLSFYRNRLRLPFVLDMAVLATFILPCLPWFLRDFLWSGNPIYPVPFLIDIFPLKNGWEYPFFPERTYQPVGNMITLLFRLNSNCGMLCKETPGVAMAGLPLLFLPWAYGFSVDKRKKKELLGIFIYALFTVYFSFLTMKSARYSISIYPVLAFLSAMNIDVLSQFLRPKKVFPVIIAIALILSSGYIIATRLTLTVTLWSDDERYPIRYLIGRQTSEQFLSETLPVYEALRFLDKEAPNDKVLSLGNESRGYTSAKIFGPIFSPEARKIMMNSSNQEDFITGLIEKEYDYILIYPSGQRKDWEFYTSPYMDDYFFKSFTQLVFARNTVLVYKFYPDGAPAPRPTQNLLINPGFEGLSGLPILSPWEVIGEPIINQEPGLALSGDVSITVRGPSVSVLYQDVTINPGDLYTAGYWVKSNDPNQKVQVFFSWLNQQKHEIGRTADWQEIKSEWSHYSISATAPNNSKYARIFISISTSGTATFDNMCFSIGQECR